MNITHTLSDVIGHSVPALIANAAGLLATVATVILDPEMKATIVAIAALAAREFVGGCLTHFARRHRDGAETRARRKRATHPVARRSLRKEAK